MKSAATKRNTLAEIALASGCSKSVASTVLNRARGNTGVSEVLRRRIERIAREVGYVPNHASRSLAIGSSETVGVYICPTEWAGVGSEYESAILRGVDLACQEAGYDMLILNITGQRTSDECVKKLAGQRMDGLVVVRARADDRNMKKLVRFCDNLVGADYNDPEPASFRATSFNNAAAMRLAVEHLVQLGHRRIGYIGCGKRDVPRDDTSRRAGFLGAMADFDLPFDPAWMICLQQHSTTPPGSTLAMSWGWDAVDQLLALPDPRPTAWVVWGDSIAVTMMQRLTQRGVTIPREISLVGVDNSAACRIVWPGLTSVDHPLAEIGAQAARMVIHRSRQRRGMASGPAMHDRYTFEPHLVVRGTTGPCPADQSAPCRRAAPLSDLCEGTAFNR